MSPTIPTDTPAAFLSEPGTHWSFHAEYSAAPGRWPLRVSCCDTQTLRAVRRMRRSFPPEPGTRLVRLVRTTEYGFSLTD